MLTPFKFFILILKVNNIFFVKNKFLIFLKYRPTSLRILQTCCKIHEIHEIFLKHAKMF
jgi:hypothetical protein